MNLTDKISIFYEDYYKLMSRSNDKQFDFSFVDPEYGIGESSKNHKSRNTRTKQKNGNYLKANDPIYTKKEWDSKPPDDIFFHELKRVSKNQIIFGANYFKEIVGTPFKPPRRNEFSDFLKKYPKGWIIWDKVNFSNDFSDCELIYTSLDFDSFIVYYMWNGMMQGQEVSTDLQKALIQIGDKSLNEKRHHPTQKPIKIYKWLIRQLKISGKILDTGFGSGNIIIACIDAGLYLTACDNEKEYYDAALFKSKNHILQYTIFNHGCEHLNIKREDGLDECLDCGMRNY